MGQSGGPSTTTTKQTTSLPAWLKPYAQGLAGQAAGMYGAGSQYPQQQVAGLDPTQQQGFQDVQNTYDQLGGIQNQLQGLTGQLGQYTNAFGQLGQASAGLGGNVYGGLGGAQNQLNNIMSGAYLDPSSNKYLQDYYNAAASPVIANYQQAVAPNLLANAVGSGGLGSSGTAQAFSNAQSQLGASLQDLASNMYEPAYQSGLSQMTSAIGQEPGMASAWYTPVNQQAGLLGQQMGATQNQLGALGQALGANQMQGQAAQNILGIGGQQQQQAQNVLNAAFQNQMMPYQMLQQAAGLIGPISGNTGSQVTVSPNTQATK